MRKRIIALLLALILTVGLLPTVALAADGDPTTDTKTSGVDSEGNKDNPVHIVKSATTDADGNGTLKLEAYVTDPMTIKTSDVPLDIVLVLDQSGSMGFCVNCGAEFTDGEWSNGKCKYTQYVEVGFAKNLTSSSEQLYAFDLWRNSYDPVEYCDGNQHRFSTHSAGWYWKDSWHDWDNRIGSESKLYKKVTTESGQHVHRLDTLTSVLGSFTQSVVGKATGTPNVKHRIAMVGFASSGYNNTEILTGVELSNGNKNKDNDYYYFPTYTKINGVQKTRATTTNYKNALVDVSQTTGQSSVTAAIGALTAQGGTQTDDGLEMAAKIFENNPLTGNDKGRKRIVILFTDGDSDDEKAAKKQASALKNTYNATVYTVGLFAGADQTKTNGNNGFLQNVSSNNGKAPREGEKSYYLAANDAISLQKVFEQITEEVNKLMLNVGASTVLSDTLSEYFDFDIPANGVLSDKVTFKLVPVDSKDADGNFTWKSTETILTDKTNPTRPTLTLSTTDPKSFTVTNFDYGANKITRVYDQTTGQITGYTGNKLVIEIPIKADTNCTSWDAKKDTYPTNSSTNGAKLAYWDEKNNPRSTGVASPEAPVARYSVTYEYVNAPTAAGNPPTDGTVYVSGQTYEVKEATIPTGYTFDGWYTNQNCTGTRYDAKTIQTITANVALYGKFTKSVFPVDLSAYIKKHLTLNGNISALPNPESFEIKLQEFTMNGGTKTNVGTAITANTAAIVNTPSGGVPFTVGETGKLELSLSVGTHTFDVTETPGSTDKMSYGTTSQILTVTVGANGAVTDVNPTGGIIITNTYNPDNPEFNLTGKFQKHLTSNTADVPSKSFELTITGTSDNTDKSTITGTAAVGTLTASGTSYTGSANFTFKKGTEAVSALTFPAAGTYIYKVQETNSNVAGMSYDTTEYTLTVVVADNAGALEITSAIVTKPGTSDTPVNVTDLKTSFLTIENTFTAAELPLDPPDGPGDPEKPTLGAKVIKSLTGDTKTETFQAQLLEGTTVKATASAVATTDAPAAFKGFGTLVFTEAKTYNYTIKEIPGSTAGMKYDERFRNGHTMNITVEAEDNKLVVKTVTIDGNDISFTATTPWLTITNTYTEPTYAVEKSVINDDASGNIPDSLDRDIYQYPTDDKYIVEKTYTSDTITFLYVIEVSGKNGAEMTIKEKDGGKFISVDYSTETRATINPNAAQDTYTVKLTEDVDASDPIKLYAKKTFTKVEGKFPTTATNALLVNGEEGPKDDTTIIERGSTVIDFSKMVQKHLTATGNGTVSEVTFYVDVDGRRDDAIAYALPEVTIPDTYRLVLMATFNSVTGNGYDETKPFEGAIAVNQAGVYIFKLTERTDAAQTSIMYDETEYLLYVNVEPKSDGSLEVTDWYIVGSDNTELRAPEKITFHNTIDTGRDDYIPIIIPTIINKDTGMLNKTDHFAYVIGYPDGTVHPNGQITRAEVATIFFRLLRDEVRDGAFTTSNSYSDVAYGKWYNNPISTMSALGIITGYPDGTFKPNKPITRAEFAAIAARFDETQSGKSATFSDVIGHWAAKEIGIAYYNDWIKGYPDGTFKPDQNITRAEAMTLINRVLERKPESPADLLTNMNKWTDNMDTSKWYYLDVQEATNSHGYTRKTFNYELWHQMLPDPDWSRYER